MSESGLSPVKELECGQCMHGGLSTRRHEALSRVRRLGSVRPAVPAI